MIDEMSTKDRLVAISAQELRRRGYHGVGLNDILTAAGVPKGSLYHHFPGGKADLALAAADLAASEMNRIIDDSFVQAQTVRDGIQTLCHKIAKLFDKFDKSDGCPVTSVLFDSPENTAFRQKVSQVLDGWMQTMQAHAMRLDMDEHDAESTAETVLMLLEGAWILARARQNSDVIRSLASRVPLA